MAFSTLIRSQKFSSTRNHKKFHKIFWNLEQFTFRHFGCNIFRPVKKSFWNHEIVLVSRKEAWPEIRWPEKRLTNIQYRLYCIVHKIVHFDWEWFVREIFMCFELMILVHASSHSIWLQIFEFMIIVHCSSQSMSRSHDFSTPSSWIARTVY